MKLRRRRLDLGLGRERLEVLEARGQLGGVRCAGRLGLRGLLERRELLLEEPELVLLRAERRLSTFSFEVERPMRLSSWIWLPNQLEWKKWRISSSKLAKEKFCVSIMSRTVDRSLGAAPLFCCMPSSVSSKNSAKA